MQALLTTIVTWLSINFGLPAVYEHPQVELVSAARMAQVRYNRVLGSRPADPLGGHVRSEANDSLGEVHAIYDDVSKTIYLPDRWAGATPGELSMLVHEMVHHLQNVGGLKFQCAQAREKMAYVAQERWLGLFGRSLGQEFGLDAATVLLRTKCMF